MYIENNANGHGYTISDPSSLYPFEEVIFANDSAAILEIVTQQKSCLVEGGVGAGKTHLVKDLGRIAQANDYMLPVMTLRAHISGGSKKGASIALKQINDFSDKYGDESLLIIDNADYYGYSGQKRCRRYCVASEHTRVANHITEIINDDQSPMIVGTAHDDVWRENKWNFKKRKGSGDTITPIADRLIKSFAAVYHFRGKLDPTVAKRILVGNQFDEDLAEAVIEELAPGNKLSFRIVSRLEPRLNDYELSRQIDEIEAKTARLIGSTVLPGSANQIAQSI